MAYGLKYTQYIEKGGAQVQIKVYEKDWTGASYGMAHVTGLSLQIIGGQSNILSPLLKTSLSFSLVDAYDQGTTQADGTACVNAQSEKCGRWEEFFTPDATKYKVELISTPSPSASASVIWTGFITPDSWSENMIYRGSVTITARDMLGALQDKEFDLTGRVSVRDVITGALSACECPMALQLTEAHFLVNSNGHSVLDHTFAASTFSGDTWAQALEKTLDSLGLVLRYNGANKVVLTSLRYLAADTTIGAHGIEFINRSGLRQLDPALKSITETFDVDILRIDATDPETTQFTATGSNLTQKIVTHLSSGATQTSTNYIPAYTLAQAGGEGWSGSLAVPQLGTPTDDIAVRKMYIPTDIEESVEATYYNPRLRGAFVFKFTQDGPLACLTGSAGALKLSHYWGGDGVEEIRVRVEAVVGGVRKYLSGGGDWTTSADSFVISVGQEVSVPDSGAVGISIVIVKVKAATHLPAYSAVFAAMNLSVSPASEGTALISEWKTTTNYDQANNVTIKRDPVVGSAGVEGCVDFYGNVLAYGDTIAPDEWRWPGDANNYPLAVMIQAQVLCFHAAAASIFTGTAHDKATPEAAALPGYRIGYYDRVGVPLSGTYDFCSGFIAQTIAREFYTWEEVWGTFDPDYTAISGAGKGSTSATGAGGSSASGGSSGGGGGTSVNYFEPDGDYGNGIKLRDSYAGLRIPGLRFGAGREAFDLEVRNVAAEGETPVYALHSKLPFYSDSFISAGGISPGGGASAGNATLVAQTYGGTLSATGIDPINFYSKEKVDQLLATAGKVQTVAGVSPTDGDIPVASLKSALGLGAAAAYGIGSVASGNTGLVTGGSVYSAINEAVSSVMKMQGTTTTPISDGSTTNPVVIDGSSYTAKKGDVVLYDGKEYLWAGSAWEQLGDEASWALKTTSISAGTGLEGGGTLASNRTISINPTYQTYISNGNTAYGWGNHANAGYLLSATAASTYATITALNGVSGRVTTLEGRTNWDTYFGVDENGDIYVKKNGDTARNFYSWGAVSAGGLSSGGGSGGIDPEAMWQLLGAPTNEQIAASHIATALNGYATQSWVTGRGYITGINSSMITTALGYTPVAPSALNDYLPLSAGSSNALTGTLYAPGAVLGTTTSNGVVQLRDLYLTHTIMAGGGDVFIGNTSSDTPYISIVNNVSGAFVGINRVATTSYQLCVGGTFNATTLYENGTSLSNKYLALAGGIMSGIITMPGNYQIQWNGGNTMIYGGATNVNIVTTNGNLLVDSKKVILESASSTQKIAVNGSGVFSVLNLDNTYYSTESWLGFSGAGTLLGLIGYHNGLKWYDTQERLIMLDSNISSYAVTSVNGSGPGSITIGSVDGLNCPYDTTNNPATYNPGSGLFGVRLFANGDGAPGGDGYIMMFHQSAQIYIDVDPTDNFAIRTKGSSGWNSWKKVYHEGDCNNDSTPWTCSYLNVGYNTTADIYIKDAYGSHILHGGGGDFYIGYNSNIKYFKVTNNGQNCAVNIGESSSWVYACTVYGNLTATGAVTAGSASDSRLKSNITTMTRDYAKDIIMSLRPVVFVWNELARSKQDTLVGADYGVVAQEVESICPKSVSPIWEEYKRVDYTKFVTPLVAVAQDHERRIRQLERENSELKRRLNMN